MPYLDEYLKKIIAGLAALKLRACFELREPGDPTYIPVPGIYFLSFLLSVFLSVVLSVFVFFFPGVHIIPWICSPGIV